MDGVAPQSIPFISHLQSGHAFTLDLDHFEVSKRANLTYYKSKLNYQTPN